MPLSNSYLSIYEQESVFGDEKKFSKNSDRFEKLIKIIKSQHPKPKHILDIGCGSGFLANQIKTIFPKANIYGIDISQKALALAKKKYPKIKFIYADAQARLPFNNNFFELVISGEHIEHLVNTDHYLKEINRVTKTNGVLIITTPNLASWFNRILLLFGKQPFKTECSLYFTLPIFSINRFTFPENLSTPAMGHLRLFTLDMLIKFTSLYGFEPLSTQGRTMLTKPILRQIDSFFAAFPSLACGLIIQSRKKHQTKSLLLN